MARKFLTPINLSYLELQDATIQNKSASTINGITPVAGQLYYDSTNNVLRVAMGTTTSDWYTIATNRTTGSYSSSFGIGGTTLTIGSTANQIRGVIGSTLTIGNSNDAYTTWNGANIGVGYGGTGLNSYTTGDLLYASGTTTISKLGIGTANYVLTVNSGATAPQWTQYVPVGSGGTGTGTGSITGTGALTFTAGGSNTNVNLVPQGTGTVDVGSKKITNVAYPTSNTDAANKQYVDDVVAGIDWKQSVKYTTDNGTTLKDMFSSFTSGTVTEVANLGGYAQTITISTSTTWSSTPTWQSNNWTSGDRILVRSQAAMTSPSVPANAGNGIYTINSQPTSGSAGTIVLTRATDADDATNSTGGGNASELAAGAAVYVEAGTYAGTSYVLTTTGTITLGTTAQNWTPFTGAASFTWGNGLTNSSGNTIAVNLDSSPSGLKFNTAKLAVDASQLWIGSSNVVLASSAPASQALTGITTITGVSGSALGLYAFAPTGTSSGYGVTFYASDASTAGNGGAVLFSSGSGAGSTGNGGGITFTSGNGGAGGNANAGTISFDTGSPVGTGTATITIGGGSAKTIYIGRTSGGTGNASLTTIGIGSSATTTSIAGTTKLSALTTNGVLTTTSGDGTLAVNTTYTRRWAYGNPSLTVTSTAITWTITYDSNIANLSNVKHNFAAASDSRFHIVAQLSDYSTGQVYDADITIAPTTGTVTVSASNPAWTTTPLSANTLELVLIG